MEEIKDRSALIGEDVAGPRSTNLLENFQSSASAGAAVPSSSAAAQQVGKLP